MRSHVRFLLSGTLVAAISVLSLSATAAQGFGVQSWFASNCKVSTCQKGATEEEELTNAKTEGYPQASGHPPFGITDFKLKTVPIVQTLAGQVAPEGNLKNLRVDVAPGVSTNPEAVVKCSVPSFTGTAVEVEPGLTLFTPPACPESEIGENIVKTVIVIPKGKPFEGQLFDQELKGKVYNLQPLEQPEKPEKRALSSLFGVALEVAPGFFAHTFIEGNVEWGAEPQGTGKADYHDFFEIKNIPQGLLQSRLIFFGNKGTGGFLTNPSSCSGPGPATTTRWSGESYEKASATATYTTPIGTEGCNGLPPFALAPFAPTLTVKPESTQSDAPDGLTTELQLPHDPNPEKLDSSQLKTASVTLPEGMTFNESAAREVTEHCTPAQIGIHTRNKVQCPPGSKIGTVTLNVPGLPPESLKGNMYLGGPESGPITGPPYVMYLDAESERYGISVRLKGEVVPNATTGRLTATFSENPEQPFTNAILRFNSGPFAPLANPLVCGTATTNTSLAPYTGTPAQSPFSQFVVDSNGKAAACASPLPFSLTQSTENSSANAGGHTSTTFNLVRPSGDQYLSRMKTTLPPGLVGAIPAVTLCGEPQASAGTCPSTSQIGTATVEAGAGLAPFTFKGTVYMTGPYNGAPFGLSIAVAAVAGPFNLGTVVTRATVNVDPLTSRVIVEATLPRIIKAVGKASSGILLRLRKISVTVNKQGFLYNPTNCSALSTETTAYAFTAPGGGETGSFNLASPFRVGNCGALHFKPSFKATSNAKTSKLNGASLETTINQAAGQANIKSITVQLPIQLPSRLTTLQQACLAATFEANPFHCPKGSFVGGARANTPLLPAKMTGPAILVSHANLAFPDLDLVLEANGVRVILVGNTDIKKGITITKFASVPDAPVSSATVNLPIGPHSSLSAFGSLCAKPLLMPTTIVGQNGTTIKQKTRIFVRGCPVKILRRRVRGNAAFVTVETFAGGHVSGSGGGLATVYRRLRGPATITLRVPLSRSGLGRGRPFSTRVRVGFVPSSRSEHATLSFAGITFF
jgi:hypothetical protein